MLKEAHSAWASFATAAGGRETGPPARDPEVTTRMEKEGIDSVRKKLPPLIEEVEDEFRRLVGEERKPWWCRILAFMWD